MKPNDEIKISPTVIKAVNGAFTGLKVWFWICFAVFIFVVIA